MPTSLEVYAFLDKKQDGAFPVFDIEGAVIANVTTSYWNRSWQAVDGQGQPLCHGKPKPLSRTFTVFDSSDHELFEMRSDFWSSKRRTVTLADGSELRLDGGSWLSRDWHVTDANGQVALSIVSTASGWSFHPDAYAVQVADPALTLAHVVGIVETNRVLVKAARNNN